jgi:flagellum-specific ATP synthase
MKHYRLSNRLAAAEAQVAQLPGLTIAGRVAALSGLAIEVSGLSHMVSVGDRLLLATAEGHPVPAEIVSFRRGVAQAMPFGSLAGLGPGSTAALPGETLRASALPVSDAWLGRVVDPLGRALDGRGPLRVGPVARPVRQAAPAATLRGRLGPRISLGVRALDAFVTSRRGQRLGLFAGSGIGKSTLLGMLARQTDCDVVVLALVGERGREVREFLEDDLGEAGRARSVAVVATSDAPPLMRREAAYAAMTVAEHFRDQGLSVLLLMDSVTRFCLALREIGLSAGEPPATRGFPPSVFAELPRLLERAGPGVESGAAGGAIGYITALFTVLVEGDDHNEPVADAVRGILDGHVVLDRRIGERGRYPAVPGCNSPEDRVVAERSRRVLALAAEMADLVRLGAYRMGTDREVDEALRLTPMIERILRQARDERSTIEEAFSALRSVVGEMPEEMGA